MSTAQRVVVAAMSAIGAAVGTIAGGALAFVLGPIGWGLGGLLLVGATAGGAVLGRRLASGAQEFPVARVVAATLGGLVITLFIDNSITSCTVGDAVVWQCGAVAWAVAFGAAVVAALMSEQLTRHG